MTEWPSKNFSAVIVDLSQVRFPRFDGPGEFQHQQCGIRCPAIMGSGFEVGPQVGAPMAQRFESAGTVVRFHGRPIQAGGESG